MNSNLIKFYDTITLNVVEIRDHIASIISINIRVNVFISAYSSQTFWWAYFCDRIRKSTVLL